MHVTGSGIMRADAESRRQPRGQDEQGQRRETQLYPAVRTLAFLIWYTAVLARFPPPQ